MLGIALGVAVIAVFLASRSVAYPLALGGLSAVAVALHGAKIGGEGTVPMLLFAWIAAAIAFELLGKEGGLPVRAWIAVPVLATVALWILMLARLPETPGGEAGDYGTLKVKLFLAENLTLVFAGLLIGRRKEHFDLFLKLTMFVATISAFVLVEQLVSGEVETTIAPGRETLFDLNPILLGRSSAAGLIVAVYLALVSRTRWLRLSALAVIPLLAVSLLAAGSRGPVLGLAFGLLALLPLVLRERASRRRFLPLVLGVIAAFLLVQELVPGQSVERAGSIILASGSTISSNGRTELWSTAYERFKDDPLLGVGPGGFAAVAPAFYPHNLFLEVGVELGLVGIVLLVAILAFGANDLVRAWRTGTGADRQDAALVLALLVAAFLNSLFSGALQTNSPLWLAIGLGLGLALRASEPLRRPRTRETVA
jgi:O-antigen ligase